MFKYLRMMSSMKEKVKDAISENTGGLGHKLASPEKQFSLEQVPDLSGKVAVVTGGSEGIGYGCTHTLLSHNISKLFILSKSSDIASDAINAIRDELGDDKAKRVEWLQCDLSDWPATGQTAFKIRQSTDKLHILINNASRGIMTAQKAPQNGVDLHMATNHMGHVVLTSHLLPLLKKTAQEGKVRIVNLGSNMHQFIPKNTRFESVEELNQDFGPNEQYGRSKLALILYAKYLDKHLHSKEPNILINATHPGIVETRQSSEHVFEPYPLGGYAMQALKPIKKDIMEGCVSTMYAATYHDGSGDYICPPAIVEEGSKEANDMEMAERLMRLTREVVKDKTKSESVDKGCQFEDA